MVKRRSQHSEGTQVLQGAERDKPEPNKIAASTHYDFKSRNLTPYGGLFPVATMLERLGLQKLVDETLTIKRIPRAMTIYQFVLPLGSVAIRALVRHQTAFNYGFQFVEPGQQGAIKACSNLAVLQGLSQDSSAIR